MRQELTPSSPMLDTTACTTIAAANTPNSRGATSLATTIITRMLMTFTRAWLAALQAAPLRRSLDRSTPLAAPATTVRPRTGASGAR